MKLVFGCTLSIAVLFLGCLGQKGHGAPPGGPKVGPERSVGWLTGLGREHPLVGKIWDVEHRVFVTPEQLLGNLQRSGSNARLLLGEKHDNPDHHRLQAELVRALASARVPGAVAFEMFDIAQQPTLDRYLHSPQATADGLGPALGWEHSGWPAWDRYAPIAREAMAGGLALLGANLPAPQVRAVAHEGLTALDQAKRSELHLTEAFPAELDSALQSELATAHCGQLPAAALPRMAAAQHARDAQMAAVLARAPTPAVLIAGAGHVRKDYGVPYFVHQAAPTVPLQSIAFIEVETTIDVPEGYAARFASAALPFDLVWFTPRANDDDPCAAFHK